MSAVDTLSPQRTGTTARQAIGLDVGGSKIAGAVVTASGHATDFHTIPTPTAPGLAMVQALLDLVDQLRQRHPGIEAIGVGAAGIVEWPRGYIRWAPNNSYRNLPLRELLADATGLPVVVDNDANAAAWAEARLGLGAIHDNIAFVSRSHCTPFQQARAPHRRQAPRRLAGSS